MQQRNSCHFLQKMLHYNKMLPQQKKIKIITKSSSEEINEKSLSRLKYLGVKFHSLTHSMGGIFKYEFVANLPLSLLVKEF